MGKSPQLVTGSGRVITERSAIALYLISTYDTSSKFQIPAVVKGDNDAVREEQLISLGGTGISPLFIQRLVFAQLVKRSPFFVRPLMSALKAMLDRAFLDAEVDLLMGYLDAQLEGREWFMGGAEPTRVDFLMQWYVDSGYLAGFYDVHKYERVEAWRKRCVGREAWKRGLEKGNGYHPVF
jgi:glutathione S-transferase